MEQCARSKEFAQAANSRFDARVERFLRKWIRSHEDKTLLRFNRPLHEYLATDALRDFFLHTQHPLPTLLQDRAIARHLSRIASKVYFDPVTSDPLLSQTEQRIYNLARRIDHEEMHVPFRFIHPNKQTEEGDNSDVNTYPPESELRYNSGNHFASRPANGNVFDENSRLSTAKSAGNLHVVFKRGYLEDRLHEIKVLTAAMHAEGETELQFFVICSRHSIKEGHFGASLVIMDPANPDFPVRVMVCDTLLKDLPHHPRWWLHFVAEYSNVFGEAIAEIIEDLSHPLQKVNIKGDNPYRHDWDCPYYVASMTNALADLVKNNAGLVLNGSAQQIHGAMKQLMPDYYRRNGKIKERAHIQRTNHLKRWKSGREVLRSLMPVITRKPSMEL